MAHSTYNLSDVGSSETEEKKKNQQKKKSNRISRVIEEFISMGDAISYADKRLSKYDWVISFYSKIYFFCFFLIIDRVEMDSIFVEKSKISRRICQKSVIPISLPCLHF